MERILIIDEDTELCAWLSKYLQTEGLEAIAVHEGNKVHISSLRKKLGHHSSGFERIRIIRNLGYLYGRMDRPFSKNLRVDQKTRPKFG
jgi:DNA-binding response OmpR family regulator